MTSVLMFLEEIVSTEPKTCLNLRLITNRMSKSKPNKNYLCNERMLIIMMISEKRTSGLMQVLIKVVKCMNCVKLKGLNFFEL
jgi:hypothetical protein